MQIPGEAQGLFPDFPLEVDKNVRGELNCSSWGKFLINSNICKVIMRKIIVWGVAFKTIANFLQEHNSDAIQWVDIIPRFKKNELIMQRGFND